MKSEAPRRPRKRGARRPSGEGERVFDGLAVSPGIAIGPAHLHEAGDVAIPENTLAADKVEAERDRFRAAVDKSLRQLSKLGSKSASLPPNVAEEIGFLLDAHVQMLSHSRLVQIGRAHV